MALPKGIRTLLRGVTFGIPVVISIVDVIGYVAKVEGVSMQPVLNPDVKTTDYVLLNRWTVRNYAINRGDIVSLFSPRDPDQKIIKRVIGLEGDMIKTLSYRERYVRVPIGHCWVEGDHHGHSMDSNSFGPVAVGLVNARASHIVWPPQRWKRLDCSLPEQRKPVNLLNPEVQMLFPDKFGIPGLIGEKVDEGRSTPPDKKSILFFTVNAKMKTQ